LTLRAVLTNPAEGFQSAVKAADRRKRVARRPAEGLAPYALSALGGSALLLLWLKLGGLVGLREATERSYRPVYLVLTVVAGAVLGLVGQFLWGFVGARVLSETTSSSDMRLVWGAASLPLCGVVLILLPLDLLIAGPEVYTTERLEDPLATAWAAFSMAVGVALALWAAYLLVRGLKVAADEPRWRVSAAALVALIVVCAVFVPLVLGPKLR
jgi:MFS family permease